MTASCFDTFEQIFLLLSHWDQDTSRNPFLVSFCYLTLSLLNWHTNVGAVVGFCCFNVFYCFCYFFCYFFFTFFIISSSPHRNWMAQELTNKKLFYNKSTVARGSSHIKQRKKKKNQSSLKKLIWCKNATKGPKKQVNFKYNLLIK